MIDENVCWIWNVSIIGEERTSWCRDKLYYIVIYYGALCNTSIMMGYVLCSVTINLY